MGECSESVKGSKGGYTHVWTCKCTRAETTTWSHRFVWCKKVPWTHTHTHTVYIASHMQRETDGQDALWKEKSMGTARGQQPQPLSHFCTWQWGQSSEENLKTTAQLVNISRVITCYVCTLLQHSASVDVSTQLFAMERYSGVMACWAENDVTLPIYLLSKLFCLSGRAAHAW